MSDRNFHIRISPEVISGDRFFVRYNAGNSPTSEPDPCCEITTTSTTIQYTGYTIVYSSMTEILSGGTNGVSLLTGLTIPIMLSQTAVDVGHYSVFDGAVSQKDTMINFLVSGSSSAPYECYFYNTSEVELKKYLSFTNYYINWGDSSSTQIIGPNTPFPYIHNYSQPGQYTITFSGMSPWGNSVITKKVSIPFTAVTIDNISGTAYFTPLGGSWSGTSLDYDYLFSGDTTCEIYQSGVNPFLDGPLVISGYTNSSINDLVQYGPKNGLIGGKFKPNTPVTGSTGVNGIVYQPSSQFPYTAYTINSLDYFDYPEDLTIFVVSGVTPIEVVCSAITKEEYLLNVVDEPEVQSAVFVERGKNSALERIMRLGEVDNVGDLTKYGYGFFNVIKT
jgi:hypothetical protein